MVVGLEVELDEPVPRPVESNRSRVHPSGLIRSGSRAAVRYWNRVPSGRNRSSTGFSVAPRRSVQSGPIVSRKRSDTPSS